MDNSPSIVFAFYKNNELIGYRQDTLGSIGMSPKIYNYSKSQVETVIKNITSNLEKESGFGKILGIPELAEQEKLIHETIKEQKVFELRVLKCPDRIYEKEFDIEKAEYVTNPWPVYPVEEIKKWLLYPDQHEVIETHYFGMNGKINLN